MGRCRMGSNTVANQPPQYPYTTTGSDFSSLTAFAFTNGDVLQPALSKQVVTSTTNSASRQVSVVLNKDTRMVVEYYPSIFETCKFKWSRYLAFAIIFYYILSTLFKLFMKEGMLDSQTTIDKVK